MWNWLRDATHFIRVYTFLSVFTLQIEFEGAERIIGKLDTYILLGSQIYTGLCK